MTSRSGFYEIAEASIEMKFLYGALRLEGLGLDVDPRGARKPEQPARSAAAADRPSSADRRSPHALRPSGCREIPRGRTGLRRSRLLSGRDRGMPRVPQSLDGENMRYLHGVLDVWFEREVRPRLRGRAVLLRYADDFVVQSRWCSKPFTSRTSSTVRTASGRSARRIRRWSGSRTRRCAWRGAASLTELTDLLLEPPYRTPRRAHQGRTRGGGAREVAPPRSEPSRVGGHSDAVTREGGRRARPWAHRIRGASDLERSRRPGLPAAGIPSIGRRCWVYSHGARRSVPVSVCTHGASPGPAMRSRMLRARRAPRAVTSGST